MTQVENVTGPVAYHAEGSVWSPSWGGLRYTDAYAGDLLTLRGDRVDRLHVGKFAAFFRPRSGGGFVVGLERRIGLAGTPDGEVHGLPDLWRDTGIRLNDGTCSPAGTLYGGTMSYQQTTGAGTLYRFDGRDLKPEVVASNVTISNGIGFSPDGSLAYYNDTPTGRVDVFDNVEDHLVGRRPFVTIDDGDGKPDGLTVDAEGGVWVACWGGSAVRHFAADGTLQQVVELPVTQVSCCCFGGEDLKTLYITTSRENLPEGEEPEAGSVYACQPGATGMPIASLNL